MVHGEIVENLPPLKGGGLRKKEEEKEDEIKRNLQIENQSYNDWIFQINCNKLKWVNPRGLIEGKNHCCVSCNKLCLKGNNKTAHWVGYSKLNHYIYNIFKRTA